MELREERDRKLEGWVVSGTFWPCLPLVMLALRQAEEVLVPTAHCDRGQRSG